MTSSTAHTLTCTRTATHLLLKKKEKKKKKGKDHQDIIIVIAHILQVMLGDYRGVGWGEYENTIDIR
jgi:hypothetical protein